MTTFRNIMLNVYYHPWIDKELLHLIKKKNIQRKKLGKTQSSVDYKLYKKTLRDTKQLISKMKKDYNKKLTESLFENPKHFWSAVKLSTKTRQNANFLRTDNDFTTDKLCMANILNKFFHSVFNTQDTETPSMASKLSIPHVLSYPTSY